MMKRSVAIYFLSLHLVVVLRPFSPYAEYLVNYDYISNVLCVNKATPELNCNGACHLTNEIKKAMEDETAPVNQSKTQKEFSVYLTYVETFVLDYKYNQSNLQHTTFVISLHTLFQGKPEVPPPQA